LNFSVGLCAPPFQPLIYDTFADLSITNSIQCRLKAKEQIRGNQQRREVRQKGRGRERPTRRRKKVGRSREHSRSMFDIFWYTPWEKDEVMEL
jgi:hypothetical protein